MLKGPVSPTDKSLKRPAREAKSGRKILLPHSTFAVIPLIIELIHNKFDDPVKSRVDG